jgi:hypothetical protein
MKILRRHFLWVAAAAVTAPAVSPKVWSKTGLDRGAEAVAGLAARKGEESTTSMSALTLLIIRHAEKPEESWPGLGFTEDGVVDRKSLVIRGWERAGSWAALFGAGLAADAYPPPAVIYAADPIGTDGDDKSQRPFETIVPLARRLNRAPITTYAVGQENELVDEVVGLTGVVLIAWEHKAIAGRMLPRLANGQVLPGMPRKWDGARYDVVLRFDRSTPGAPWSFRQLFPRLLSGDSDAPMS